MSHEVLKVMIGMLGFIAGSDQVLSRVKSLKPNSFGEFCWHFFVGGCRNVVAEKPAESIADQSAEAPQA